MPAFQLDQPAGVGVDTNGDGWADSLGYDTNGDGFVDSLDTNGDGRVDRTFDLSCWAW